MVMLEDVQAQLAVQLPFVPMAGVKWAPIVVVDPAIYLAAIAIMAALEAIGSKVSKQLIGVWESEFRAHNGTHKI